jgi:hypothetical protein
VRALSSFGLRTRVLSLSAAVLGGETIPEKSKPSMGAGRVALPASSRAVQINEHDGVVVSGLLGSSLAARSKLSKYSRLAIVLHRPWMDLAARRMVSSTVAVSKDRASAPPLGTSRRARASGRRRGR